MSRTEASSAFIVIATSSYGPNALHERLWTYRPIGLQLAEMEKMV